MRIGIVFNKYNPFFCQGGGHSLCSLDFPWGHVRLTPIEFDRYMEEYRRKSARSKELNHPDLYDTVVAKWQVDSSKFSVS